VARGTTLRNIRVADEVWLPAKERAQQNGETLSDVVRRALVEYVTAAEPNDQS